MVKPSSDKIGSYGMLLVVCLMAIFSLAVPSLDAQSSADHQDRKSCLWSIQTQSNKIYLLGSLHFFKQDAYPLSASINKAYANSRMLVFETDIEAMQTPAVQARMMKLGMYPDGQDLLQNIDTKTRQSLERKLSEFGLPIEAFSRFRPWFVAIQIEVVQLLRLGFSPEFGIDIYFFNKAKSAGKKMGFLESTEFQIDLLGNMVEQNQNALLKQTLKELADADELAAGLVKFWKAGDSDRLHGLLSKSFKGYPDLYDRLIIQRNKNWVKEIEDLMKSNKNVLFVVGAGHLVGPDSVVDLLRKKGYQVNQQ